MKKFLTALCLFALVSGIAVTAVACTDTQENGHSHVYGDWTVETEPTLFEDGKEYRVCTAEDCPDADKGREERALEADGKTNALFDYFTYTATTCQKGDEGIILNKNTGNNSGGATYFSKDASVKNYAWDGAETTLSFTLDLSVFTQENDFTAFVLAFNQESDASYVFVDEIRIGIVKTADGFLFNELTGIDHANVQNTIAAVKGEGAKSFTGNTPKVSFTFAYAPETKTLSYTLSVAGQSIENTKTPSADIVGLRSLWNAQLNKDGVELYDLVKD